MPVGQPIGRLRRRLLLERRGVVLQPRQAQRRVEPHAAQEAELARPSGRCTATGAGRRRRRARCRRRCGRGRGRPRRCRRRRRSRTAPTPATTRTPTPPWPRRSGPATARASSSRRARRPRPDAGDAHLLGRRRRGADDEQVAGETVVRRHRLLDGPLDTGSPHRRQHGRDAGDEQQHQRRVDRRQQQGGDDEAEDPAEVAEQRREEVVEGERLVAQHGEAVEVLRPLLVLDRRHRRLEVGDVRLDGDRQAIAEPALQPLVEDVDVPGERRRDGEADGRDDDRRRVAVEDAVGEQLEPQRQQRVGQHHHAASWRATPAAAAARRGSRSVNVRHSAGIGPAAGRVSRGDS